LEVTEKIDKRLVAKGVFKTDGNIVNLITAGNETAEAEKIAEEIAKLTGYGEYARETEKAQIFDDKGQSSLVSNQEEIPYKFSDIAILVRANSHSEAIVQALRDMGISYKLGGSRGLYFRPEIQDIIAFMKVLIDYTDEISMYRILAMPIWELSPREYMDVNRLAREEKTPIFKELETLWNVKLGEEKSEGIAAIENNLVEKLFDAQSIASITNLLIIFNEALQKIKDGRPITEILYDFVKTSGYLNSFVKENTAESLFAVSNIQKFFESIRKYEKDNPNTNIYEYLDYLNYCIEVGESPVVDQLEMEDFNAVNILTVHGAKGLEYPVVFMVNLVAQRFPSRNMNDAIPMPEDLVKEVLDKKMSAEESHMQEDRRLFYVGATRAKEKLYLTAASFYGDAKTKKKPSIFLYEILDRDVSEEFSGEKKDIGIDSFEAKAETSITGADVRIQVVKNFSYSQLDTYEVCPRKYEYGYILKIPQKPNAALSFGITVHNTLNNFYTLHKRAQDGIEGIVQYPTEEDMVELYGKNWVRAGYDSSKHEQLRKEQGEKILREYCKKIYSKDERILNLEENFTVHTAEYSFGGKVDRIDLVEEVEGVKHVRIVDYKTGKVKKEAEIKNDLQLPLYAIFVEQKLGYKVIGARYIFLEEGASIDVDLSEKRRGKAKDRMEELVSKIQSKDFTANPDSFKCSMCDYRSVCEFAKI